ncbi:permease for cytosine/purines, uracil, thiamine, allantoin-domain-containing protein [Halteromyces radiatus]|uniref:permease for cytosine/purines, uracil, thiamine, allantoin-domain-containing protein n=1 Tax=Halteromyces radiatus TaxID=101107 RepID=UPI00221E6893|nr:permease for cytosine/purines, uracil, thiamine, allantoin-domain-containing protein [Halteromyces radiatus]KAI8082701.1 permease for cytosine/purines, uracil, thiamine, allantoin-domain-containing protein [Halteromyces radiatus]
MKIVNKENIQQILKKLEVGQNNDISTNNNWINRDLAPIPPERRTWGTWNYVAFWISDCLNVNTFMIGGSFVALGCSWWQALVVVAIGYGLSAVVLVINGRVGAIYHIGFSVFTRASFGMYGAFIPILNRVLLGVVWYGVQAWIGGQCVYQMLRAIAPSIDDLPNSLPPNAGTTTKAFLGFFLFSLLSCVAIWFPVERIRHLFTLKSIVVPIAAISLFIWAVVNVHGLGPIVNQPSSFTSNEDMAWGIIGSIISCFGNMAALIVNQPDFARYSIKPRDIIYSQLITLPLGFFFTSFIGIVVTSASQHMYGEALWNPIDLLNRMDSRPAVFFLAFAFAFATLGTNLAANSIPVGADLAAVFPRYINMRRGGYVAAAIGFCITPWNLLSGAQAFLNFLTGYTVFLAPITGVLIADYYFVKKGHYSVADLYDPAGIYWYTYGINWRAYAAYLIGITPNLPGFAGVTGNYVSPVAEKIFKLAWPIGFIIGGGVYILCNWLFPCQWIIAEREKEVVMDPSALKKDKYEIPVTLSPTTSIHQQSHSLQTTHDSIV